MRTAAMSLVAAVVVFAAAAQAKTVPESNYTLTSRACQGEHAHYKFCDTSLSIDDRVKDLISQLKDEEIPPLLTAREGGGGSPGPAGNISRLGLPEFDWGLNALHGVQSSCVADGSGAVHCPTSFPNPVSYGMTWNKTAFFVLGDIIGTEQRALWLAGATEFSSWSGRPHMGLDCWSPNININRSPLWGRNQEVASEDPYINGEMGMQYTKGVQEGPDSRYLKVVVTLKHWDAYSLEDSEGFTRHNFDAKVSNYSLMDTYWPAFRRAVVDGNAKGVMCSYNAINGIPTCANPLLVKVLRETWNFTGYVTSDTGAVEDIAAQHKYRDTQEEGACAAIRDGRCDINSGSVYMDHLLNGVKQGHCSMDDVHAALFNSLRLRFELGLFDSVDDQPYWKVPLSAVNTTTSQAENMLATLEVMTLLKNDGVLPLAPGKKNIAVIGPHAKAQGALVGNYLGQICPFADDQSCVVTPFEAIAAMNGAGKTTVAEGSQVTSGNKTDLEAAVEVAKKADVVILLMGIDQHVESESHDRDSIDLPSCQHDLAKAITDLKKPTVLVLVNGGMVAIAEEKETVNAILETGYPGIRGSEAIARTIFGDNDHLGGKLPYTIYDKDYITKMKMTDMEMTNGVGRSYRYYKGTPLFPFGYGLSYTSFDFKMNVSSLHFTTGDTKTSVSVAVEVTNTGSRTGDEVVQLYFAPKSLSKQKNHPLIKQLGGFERVHLAPKASTTVTFLIDSSFFNLVDPATGNRISTPGDYDLTAFNGVDVSAQASVTLTGDEVIIEKFPTL